MLKSQIVVDLPSAETERDKTVFEWVTSLFGSDPDLSSGLEELTVGAFALIDGLTDGFRTAGINNAIAFLVDHKVVFKDTNDEDDDLPLIREAAEAAGVLRAPFDEMHLILTHTEGGIHYLFDIRIQNEVIKGEAEMTVDVAGRIEELRIKEGETAGDYAERIKSFVAQEHLAEAWRQAFQAKVDDVAMALQTTLVGSKVIVKDSAVEIIRPSKKQVAHFRDLKFGKDVTEPTYRAIPTRHRRGAYTDPFYYYYYDPYYDFTYYVMLDSMYHDDDTWEDPHIHVVDPGGDLLFAGDEIDDQDLEDWDVEFDEIDYKSGEVIEVADTVPEYDGNPAIDDDWGGSDVELDGGVEADIGGDFGDVGGDWGGSDVDAGGASCSSCGSSCASCSSCSSCSSCGGCGGCA